MKVQKSISEMQKRLIDSEEYIIPFSKALSHPHRYKILIFLLSHSQSFNYLQNRLGIARTATANHLSQLLEVDLVEKQERGIYNISEKGVAFLKLLLDFYNKFKVQDLNQARRIQHQYHQGLAQRITSQEFYVSSPAKYDYAWISFLASFSGVLRAIGGPWDIIDLAGYTGYAFLINVAEKILCPSAPTVYRSYIWKSMVSSIEKFGLKISVFFDGKDYPSSQKDKNQDHLRALKFKNWVEDGLKATNRSVIIWGAPIPEFAIVNGIKAEQYICSTFRPSCKMDETPIDYKHLQAPGSLWGYQIESIESNTWQRYTNERDFHAIQQGVTFLTKIEGAEGYVLGINAYQTWAQNLESHATSESDYHGNSYVGECLLEQKRFLMKFLQRMSERQQNQFGKNIQKAADEYHEISDILRKFQKLFPFGLKGTFTENSRQKGAALIRSIIPYEKAALEFLKLALENPI